MCVREFVLSLLNLDDNNILSYHNLFILYHGILSYPHLFVMVSFTLGDLGKFALFEGNDCQQQLSYTEEFY